MNFAHITYYMITWRFEEKERWKKTRRKIKMNQKAWTKKTNGTWENFKQKGKQNLFLEKQNVSCTLLFLWHLQKNTTTCLCGTFFTAQHNANLITWVLSNLPKSYEVTELKISQTFHYNYQPAHPSDSSIDWIKQEQKQAKHIEGRKRQTVISVNQLYMGGSARLGHAAEEEVTTSTAHRPPLTVSPLFPWCTAPSTSSTLMEIPYIIRCTGATVVADRKMDGSRKHPHAFDESLATSLQSPPNSPSTRNPTKSEASFSRRPFTPLPPSDT